jgi:hypothetical protein
MITSKLLTSRYFLILLAVATIVGTTWLWIERSFKAGR